jgi:hypothetical protein
MPYAIRDENGDIVALTLSPNHEGDEPLSLSSPDVLTFLTRYSATDDTQKKFQELLAQDIQQIRIVEDLIDLLTAKGVILFSELPVAAQKKILQKKIRREEMSQSNDILVDDVPIL